MPRLAPLLALLAATGCGFGSISPVFSDASATNDPRLVGTWRDSASQEGAVISLDSGTGYKIVYTEDNGKTAHFVATLGVVGSTRILNVSPDDLPGDLSDLYKSLLLPLHAPVIIDSAGAVLRFRMFEPDSIKAYLKRNPRAIAYVDREDRVVLTAPTADVQKFVATLLAQRGFLGEMNEWRRKSP